MQKRNFEMAVISHVIKFIKQMRLLPLSGRTLLAVSGGLDSMALLHILCHLKKQKIIKQIEVIHINHGTRKENLQEEQMVRDICQKSNVKCHIERLHLGEKVLNFELVAREKRYEVFMKYLGINDMLYTAHHLDDSFEWSLLQQFKSSKDCLGIPVLNGRIGRPFMCLSRAQIESYGKMAKVSFLEDPSNQVCHYERNYVRNNVIPVIAKRFPAYLKHYVHRSNCEAFSKGVHRQSVKQGQISIRTDLIGGTLLEVTEGTFCGAHDLLEEEITKLSNGRRGVLSSQIEKLITMTGHGFKGPLIFSGDVFGYSCRDSIYLLSKGKAYIYNELDDIMCDLLQANEGAQIPNAFFENQHQLHLDAFFPFIVFFKSEKLDSLRAPFSLFPKSCILARSLGYGFNTFDRVLSQMKKMRSFDNIKSILLVTHSMLLNHLK